jgi:light-regulated signal transduction histidine kinase (bacteriophytochrome)
MRTEELERSVKDMESFSYSVSHDLRAPLRAVDNFIKILAEETAHKLDQSEKSLVDVIVKNATMMNILIDDLLAFSRAGNTPLSSSYIDMDDLVKEVISDLISTENGSRTKFIVGKLHGASCDKNLLRQVWVNLLSNAVKYSSKNEQPVVTVSSRVENENVVYSVADNGAGFDMRFRDKLFGVFQRLHSKREFDGTGVGLAITSKIIQRHNGNINAEAEVNKGAVFTFYLPIQEKDA